MQVRAVGQACIPGVSHKVTTFYFTSNFDAVSIAGEVSISCFKPKAMINNQEVSVVAISFGILNDTITGRKQMSTYICPEVDSGMHAFIFKNGMYSHSKPTEKYAIKRLDCRYMFQPLLIFVVEILDFIKRHFLNINPPFKLIDASCCPFQDFRSVFTVEIKFSVNIR